MSGEFTTAADIAAHGHDYVQVDSQDIQRIVTQRTSGSTGEAKRIYNTAGDLKNTVDFFAWGMGPFCEEGEKTAVLLGNDAPDGLGQLVARALEALGTVPTLIGVPKDYAAAAEVLRQIHPAMLVGLPVQVRRLALMVPELRPESVLLSGDYVSESVKATLKRIWGCTVYTHYGLTETGLAFAVQCPELTCHHIRPEEFLVEIIDPETGENLPDGTFGEVVFTTLRREAMPLKRYRTGDISRLLPGDCPCGRKGQRLDRILGRYEELRKPVSMYALDELLLSEDSILDYAAVYEAGTLTVTIDGKRKGVRRAKLMLPEAFPEWRIVVQGGEVPPSAVKRSVEMKA